MVPNLGIFIFLQNFAIRPIRGCWFQMWQFCFQIPVQKYPNQAFMVQNLRIFTFALNIKPNSRTLIWNMKILLLNSSPKNTQISHFWSLIQGFLFHTNFSIRQIRGRWFQIWQWFFRIPAQNYQNKALFVLNVNIF